MKNLFIYLSIYLLVFSSCSKDDFLTNVEKYTKTNSVAQSGSTQKAANNNTATNVQNNNAIDEYYIDEQVATLADFDAAKYTHYPVIYSSNPSIIENHLFSNDAAMIAWAEKKPNHEKFVNSHIAGEHLHGKAIEMGAIYEFDLSGKVPVEFEEYSKAYINAFGKGKGEDIKPIGFNPSILGKFWLSDSYGGGGISVSTYPFMPSSFNNSISSIEKIGGVIVLYDNAFYKNKLTTLWFTYYFGYSLAGKPWDNAISSTIKLP